MYKFEKARTFAVVMAILNFVVAKVFCCFVIGAQGIPIPITLVLLQQISSFSYRSWEASREDLFVFLAIIFLGFTIVFAFAAYICHQLSKAEYKWK